MFEQVTFQRTRSGILTCTIDGQTKAVEPEDGWSRDKFIFPRKGLYVKLSYQGPSGPPFWENELAFYEALPRRYRRYFLKILAAGTTRIPAKADYPVARAGDTYSWVITPYIKDIQVLRKDHDPLWDWAKEIAWLVAKPAFTGAATPPDFFPGQVANYFDRPLILDYTGWVSTKRRCLKDA